MDTNERAKQYRARKRGENVPKKKPGPAPGYKHSPESVAKRVRTGAAHHAWKGNEVSVKGGRTRAKRLYRDIGPCVVCENPKSERHHIDGNTANNEPENIVALCRRCHMETDGRLDAFKELARNNQPKAVAARWR